MKNRESDIRRKLRALQHAEKIGNARKACRYFGVARLKVLNHLVLGCHAMYYNYKKL